MPFERGHAEQTWLRVTTVADPNGRQFEIRAVVNGDELRLVRSTAQVMELLVAALLTLGENIVRFIRDARTRHGGYVVGVIAISALEERVVERDWVAYPADVEATVAELVHRVEAGKYSGL